MNWQFAVSLATDAGVISERELDLLARYAAPENLAELRPVRQPVAYKNQRHLPGLFYMARLKRSLPYESRLEMIVLKQLDFDPGLTAVLPQPCTIHYTFDGKRFRHTPDYLVWRARSTPTLVDVKPRRYIETERNQRAFSAAKAAAENIAFSHTIQSEFPAVYLANLNWISGYRRLPPKFHNYAEELIKRATTPQPLEQLIEGMPSRGLILPVVYHLIWRRHLEFDMHKLLGDHTEVRLAQ